MSTSNVSFRYFHSSYSLYVYLSEYREFVILYISVLFGVMTDGRTDGFAFYRFFCLYLMTDVFVWKTVTFMAMFSLPLVFGNVRDLVYISWKYAGVGCDVLRDYCYCLNGFELSYIN